MIYRTVAEMDLDVHNFSGPTDFDTYPKWPYLLQQLTFSSFYIKLKIL